jgi:hypothetical protein
MAIFLDTHNPPPANLRSRRQPLLQLTNLSTCPQQSSQQQHSKLFLMLKNQKLLEALDACAKTLE